MLKIPRRLFGLLAAGSVAGAMSVAGATVAAAASNATCSFGSVAAGTYASLTITGFCSVDSGNVTVQHDLVLAPNAGLDATHFGSNLNVGGNLIVETGGFLGLGCGPEGAPCGTTNPADATNDTIGRNLLADGALAMIVHHTRFNGNVVQTGGGGGVNCQSLLSFPPAFTTYEDNSIGGNVIVDGLRTCWDGFFRNNVGGNVNWDNNVTWDGTPETTFQDTILHGDEDGNEITTNTISGNLNCFGNFPAIQFGDSGGIPNTVAGKVHGQCTAVV